MRIRDAITPKGRDEPDVQRMSVLLELPDWEWVVWADLAHWISGSSPSNVPFERRTQIVSRAQCQARALADMMDRAA